MWAQGLTGSNLVPWLYGLMGPIPQFEVVLVMVVVDRDLTMGRAVGEGRVLVLGRRLLLVWIVMRWEVR